MTRLKRDLWMLLLGLAALLPWPAQAAGRLLLEGDQVLFERFSGQPFMTTEARVTLKATEGSRKFRVERLPAWLTASPSSGRATPQGVEIVLTLNTGAANQLPIGFETTVIRFSDDSGPSGSVYRRVSAYVFGSAPSGAALFMTRCRGCHLPDGTGNGPILTNVYGRVAGSFPGFDYSDALPRLRKRWSYRWLMPWLTDTQGFVPGTRMGRNIVIGLTDTQRHDLIAYFRALAIQ